MTDSNTPYLTYKLDLIKTIASKAADAHYRKAFDLRIRELRVLRLCIVFPASRLPSWGASWWWTRPCCPKTLPTWKRAG